MTNDEVALYKIIFKSLNIITPKPFNIILAPIIHALNADTPIQTIGPHSKIPSVTEYTRPQMHELCLPYLRLTQLTITTQKTT